jgi:pilus assembly protein CpaB
MTRRIIAIVAAAVLAAVGAGAVLLYLRTADARALNGKQVRSVLVAAKQIPAGTTGRTLTDKGYVRKVQMPAETLPDDAVQDVGADLQALVTTATVQRGQLLLRVMFGTAVSSSSGMAIPDGKLAVAARVKATVFGPGAVRAGVKVAIFYTYTPAADDKRGTVSGGGLSRAGTVSAVTRLLMTDVEVLSIGSAINGDAPATNANATSPSGDLAVTFALSQHDAERLAHAVVLGGAINIGLLGDSSGVQPDPGVDNSGLFE